MQSRSGEHWICNSRHTREQFLAHCEKLFDSHPYLVFEWYAGKPIGVKQSAALHVFLRLIAKELNQAGFSVHNFFKEGVEIPFSDELVKEHIWRPVQRAITGKDSSQSLTTVETQKIAEYVNLALAERGVHVPWPTSSGQKDGADNGRA